MGNVQYVYGRPHDEPLVMTGQVIRTKIRNGEIYHLIVPTNTDRLEKWRKASEVLR
jgi:hypothetical protein